MTIKVTGRFYKIDSQPTCFIGQNLSFQKRSRWEGKWGRNAYVEVDV